MKRIYCSLFSNRCFEFILKFICYSFFLCENNKLFKRFLMKRTDFNTKSKSFKNKCAQYIGCEFRKFSSYFYRLRLISMIYIYKETSKRCTYYVVNVRIILEKREPNFNDNIDELKMKRTFDM